MYVIYIYNIIYNTCDYIDLQNHPNVGIYYIPYMERCGIGSEKPCSTNAVPYLHHRVYVCDEV